MESVGLLYRFDVFERIQREGFKFLVWRGTYRTLTEAEEKLRECAAQSSNEFYIKDLELGVIVAHANFSNSATV